MSEKTSRILIVERDASRADSICEAFTLAGFPGKVTVEDTLAGAQRSIAANTPDLVIASFLLADGSGTELIPADPEKGAFPVIITDQESDEAMAVAAIKAGAVDYLSNSRVAMGELPRRSERALDEWRAVSRKRHAVKQIREDMTHYQGLFEKSPISLSEFDFSGIKATIEELEANGATDIGTYFSNHAEKLNECVGLLRIVDVNEATLALYEATSKKEFTDNALRLFSGNALAAFRESLIQLAAGKTRVEVECDTATLTGRTLHVKIHITVTPGAEQTWRQVFVSVIDISARVKAENRLRKSESRLKEAQHLANMGHWEQDLKTGEESWSDELFRIYGRNPGDFIPTFERFLEGVYPQDIPGIKNAIANCVETGKPFQSEFRATRTDGLQIHLRVRGKLLYDDRGKPHKIVGATIDVTQDQRRTIINKGTTQALRMLVENRPLPDILENLALAIEKLEPEMVASILHYDAEDGCLYKGAAPSLPDFYNNAIHGLVAGPKTGSCGTAAFTRKSVIVEDVLTHPYWKEYRKLAASAGIRACWSKPVRGTNGEVIGTFALYFREPRAPNPTHLELIEELAGIVGVVLEWGRMEKDRQRYQRQVTRAQQLDVIGTLASGIAHDFRDMVAAIDGNTRLAQRHLPEDSPARKPVDKILSSATAADKLVQQLLILCRPPEASPSPRRLAPIVRDSVQLVQSITPDGVDIAFREEVSDLRAKIDAGQLQQVILNLLVNSAHALAQTTGLITIGVRRCSPPREALEQTPKLADNECVHIWVEDNGPGMEPAVKERVFDPFFTTKSESVGTGLGLSASCFIVRHFGGAITVESEPGQGARFNIFLPGPPTETPASEAQPRKTTRGLLRK